MNARVAQPHGRPASSGMGVNVPFGLKTEYDNNWVGRFQGISSEVKTININPSIAWKVNQMFSVAYVPLQTGGDPYTYKGCGIAAGSTICTYQTVTGPSLDITVRNLTGGLPITVTSISRHA